MFNNSNKKRRAGIHFEIIPMIDVMMILVLFLSVMAFLPQVQNTIQTDLPSSGSESEVTDEDVMMEIRVGGIFLDDRQLGENEVISEIKKKMGNNTDKRIVIAADKGLPYEQVVKWLSLLQKQDLRNVALATEKEE